MFRKSMHRKLVKNGAPELPVGYYYYPFVDFIDSKTRVLRMTIRRRSGFWSEEVSRWTVNPDTYFNGENTFGKVLMLCENAVRHCDCFEVEETRP